MNAIIATTGYAGFDPLGFSDYYDIKWMQEAEIKHGRICMLAVVGMVRPFLSGGSCRDHSVLCTRISNQSGSLSD